MTVFLVDLCLKQKKWPVHSALIKSFSVRPIIHGHAISPFSAFSDSDTFLQLWFQGKFRTWGQLWTLTYLLWPWTGTYQVMSKLLKRWQHMIFVLDQLEVGGEKTTTRWLWILQLQVFSLQERMASIHWQCMSLKSGHGMITVKENGTKFPNTLVRSFSVSC